jgi:hypothetical protein
VAHDAANGSGIHVDPNRSTVRAARAAKRSASKLVFAALSDHIDPVVSVDPPSVHTRNVTRTEPKRI